MLDRLETLAREYAELQARLGDPELIADQTRYTQATKRYSELEDIVDVGGRLRAAIGNAETARELSKESEGDDRSCSGPRQRKPRSRSGASPSSSRCCCSPRTRTRVAT